MVHGRETNRRSGPARPCTVLMVALLAITLLHGLLSLGAVHPPPPSANHCGPGVLSPSASSEEDERSDPRPAARAAHELGRHPAGHPGSACATSVRSHRSLPTAPPHLAVAIDRARAADRTAGTAVSGSADETAPRRLPARDVVLRC
ncbi:hypothetical protein [Streptomyces botrytidirepellens]|uniref:Uncharacterized protein n=1 Tax=Streptomyces botrytidirepellens TaxID=2486417 RepID=A0A3M8V2I2_9ACTN|nr:hypothetical protein [Streptomyces botrytidirepellens]RNG11836.1 hypothetical protein EEJ42_32585 [Streptomyces botrytidirepellens]